MTNDIGYLGAGNAGRIPVSMAKPLPVTSTTVGGGVTYADKTITSLTGSSQTLAAAASRKSLFIKNGAAAIGLNLLGGTAAIGGAGTTTLLAYEGLFLSGDDCPVGDITVIGTSTNYVTCYQGT